MPAYQVTRWEPPLHPIVVCLFFPFFSDIGWCFGPLLLYAVLHFRKVTMFQFPECGLCSFLKEVLSKIIIKRCPRRSWWGCCPEPPPASTAAAADDYGEEGDGGFFSFFFGMRLYRALRGCSCGSRGFRRGPDDGHNRRQLRTDPVQNEPLAALPRASMPSPPRA